MPVTYQGWRNVPWPLMTATGLRELEYPRVPTPTPAARVDAYNWRGKPATFLLYDARECPPSAASPAQLAAAATRATRPRACVDCGAHPQRGTDADGWCPACAHIAAIRQVQQDRAAAQQAHAKNAAELLAWTDGAVVQVDPTIPPPAPSGRARPATATRVWAVTLTGAPLLDITVRMVGPRAHWVPEGAVPREDATPVIRAALGERRPIVWCAEELRQLNALTPSGGPWPTWWDAWRSGHHGQHAPRAAIVDTMAMLWRSEVDPHTPRTLLPSVAPGTPARLLLMLQRIVASAGGQN